MSSVVAWFRTAMYSEPVVMWSCIIGGVGESLTGRHRSGLVMGAFSLERVNWSLLYSKILRVS